MHGSSRTICLAACALLAGISPAPGGTITFTGNLAGSPPLLTTIATPSSIASGTSIVQAFSASAGGVGSVAGSLLLSNLGGTPSISIQSLTVTSAAASLGFGFTVTQDFAGPGGPFLDAEDIAG